MGKLTRDLPRISPIPENKVCCEYHLEKAQFFCSHCHTSVCDFCAMDQHFEHTLQSLEKIQYRSKQMKTTCDKSVEVRVRDIQKALAELELEIMCKKIKKV